MKLLILLLIISCSQPRFDKYTYAIGYEAGCNGILYSLPEHNPGLFTDAQVDHNQAYEKKHNLCEKAGQQILKTFVEH